MTRRVRRPDLQLMIGYFLRLRVVRFVSCALHRLFPAFCFLLLASPLSAYYWEFGQNKVQYQRFDWKVMDTDKFSIIYYTGGEELAGFAKCVLDDSYKYLSRALSHELTRPAPIIIYKSHNDFEQTNVTLSMIDEGTGGFTEIYKNRVVVPYDGSYERFRHVLAHEFVHVFQFSSSRGSGFQSVMSMGLSQVPLWYIEGMAEYFSLSWDAESDMVIRDAVYWNRLKWIQELYMIEGSYLMYKEGQSILKFIADRYGEKKIGDLFRKAKGLGGIDAAFKSVLGVDTEELNRLWLRDLKKNYWAQCVGKDESPENARRLTRRKDYTFNIGPSVSPDGSEIVFLSDRGGYEGLYLMSSINGQIKTKLIDGGKTEGFESLHIRYGSVGWHPNSELIAFVAKSQGKDLLYVMNVRNKKIIRRLEAKLDRIFSPSFSPDGDRLAIRGVRDGAADIYTIDYSTGEMLQLTDDRCDDLSPSWSPDGKQIVFSSDRPAEDESWAYGDYTIFKVNAGTESNSLLREPQPVLGDHRTSHVSSPLWVQSSDSVGGGEKILFISDISGIRNLYVYDLDSFELVQLTNVIGGVFTASVSSNAQLLAFSSYMNMGWDLYLLKHPLKCETEPGPSRTYDRRHTEISEDTSGAESKSLGLRFSPDWGGGALSYSPGNNVMGSLSFTVSDLLGNHRFHLRTTSPQDLLANYYVSYFYLPWRANLGIATFQEKYYYWTGRDTIYEQRTQGVGTLVEYPFDRFQRIDFEVMGYRMTETKLLIPEGYEEISEQTFYQIVPSVSWIYDNSLWGATGPVNGSRCKLVLQSIPPIIESSILYNTYKVDIRKYVRIGSRYSFATRLMNTGIWGQDAEYLFEEVGWPWLGGVEDLRGYKPGEFSGRNAGLLNLELRHPFIDRLKIAFPLPLSIRGIRGALFSDFGYAVSEIESFRFFKDGRLKDLKSDFGCGIRFRFPYFVVKFDVAWNTDLVDVSKAQWNFSLSPEF